MAVLFKSVGRKNPQDLTAPEKYYPLVVPNGEVDLRSLAKTLTRESTVTSGDCYSILVNLEEQIAILLEEGRSVKLGHLGSFRIGISGTGSDTEEDVSSHNVTKARVLFRSGLELQRMLNNLKFKKQG
ncbi:DNA-binding protein, histone-like, putative [Pustulibacterium marinum]|uniref:DNA-binding protein, histone-like, putative n=1 Tax=Pustulibacterium marinum TaxID=1224947 RepID=A0A1I7F1Q3_9FLAO|nr:HU family DNA-binding protein [Pustulibacterium marinum]SFU30054.1 DNA-binding protein, histone-like, putative [Pustulibacterium marinum]